MRIRVIIEPRHDILPELAHYLKQAVNLGPGLRWNFRDGLICINGLYAELWSQEIPKTVKLAIGSLVVGERVKFNWDLNIPRELLR